MIGADGRNIPPAQGVQPRAVHPRHGVGAGGWADRPCDGADDVEGELASIDLFIYTPRTDSLTRLHVNAPPDQGRDPDRDPMSVDWSHDGRRIAFSAAHYFLIGDLSNKISTPWPPPAGC